MNERCAVLQFAKAPRAGQVKTRLQAMLTAEQAATVHRWLVEHQWQVLAGLPPTFHAELWVTEPEHTFWLGSPIPRHAQIDGDLGERMGWAINQTLARGYPRVLLVGSDCPNLDADYLQQAVASLDRATLVLGAATDGGYVLIGSSRPLPATLFFGVTWGGEQVLQQTLTNARGLGMEVVVLPALSDLDRPEDLYLLPASVRQQVGLVNPQAEAI